ncbi:hypothetical protein MG293_020877 [Ovis ammon polii]|uniref:C-type lectin domain-containing protein n=1 Tax=Ovis ammon polii TaxID=230172 RepID=A0AAD4TJ68_OVIAM|nr:hypothetical protein MG293_020877 [Ovis ammon polii]
MSAVINVLLVPKMQECCGLLQMCSPGEKASVSLLSSRFWAVLISPGHGPFVREFGNRGGKDLRKKCPAIGSPVTPAKLCCCILIIFILVALNVVTLSTLVADSENWTFSQTSCTSVGAVLAQFETEEELNFLQRYKGPFDHWIGLIGEPSHHAWKWTDNSKLDASSPGEKASVSLLSSRFWAVLISPGHGPFVREFGNRGGKDLRKKCPAIGSPVTPAKLCCCILIIFILVALNVVTLSTLVADSENWTFSQTSCTSVGAVLAQFETEEELNFLQRYKGPFDHWIGLIGEPSHHAWKWTDNSKLDASFVVRGNGEYAFLNNFGITASINRAIQRRWICSKTNSNVSIPLHTSRPF